MPRYKRLSQTMNQGGMVKSQTHLCPTVLLVSPTEYLAGVFMNWAALRTRRDLESTVPSEL
jgi:hypothetical protein